MPKLLTVPPESASSVRQIEARLLLAAEWQPVGRSSRVAAALDRAPPPPAPRQVAAAADFHLFARRRQLRYLSACRPRAPAVKMNGNGRFLRGAISSERSDEAPETAISSPGDINIGIQLLPSPNNSWLTRDDRRPPELSARPVGQTEPRQAHKQREPAAGDASAADIVESRRTGCGENRRKHA